MNYTQLLKTQEWDLCRANAVRRAKYSCQDCGSSNVELHVHHLYYTKGKLPWEYPDRAFVCLCLDCHLDAEFLLREIRELTVYLPSKSYIKTLWEVLGYIKAASSKNGFSFPVDNYDELEGFAAYFRATETPSIYELPEAMVDEVAGKDMFKRTLHKLASRSRRRKSQRFIGGEGI